MSSKRVAGGATRRGAEVEAAGSDAQLESLVERRVAGLPLEHLLGWAEFCGLRIRVGEGVFVPRRRTEFLVDLAAPFLRPGPIGPQSTVVLDTVVHSTVVLDLCCGSGAVGAALAERAKLARGEVELYASDIEPTAVRYARLNLEAIGGQVFEGDLFDALPVSLKGRVDILAVNAPYVPTTEIANMPQEARLHEPRLTLDGGSDGLDLHRRIAEHAEEWLAPDARVFIETSQRQAPTTARIFERNGFIARVEYSDDLDSTVVVCEPGLR